MTTKVLYATANNGKPLPVIDVTNPAFLVAPTEEELDAMTAQFLHDQQHQQQMSPALLEALRNSTLGKAVMAATGSYLSGMATYQMKLGPRNMGPGASPIDQSIASSFPAFSARIRLQDMAALLAESLAQILAVKTSRSLYLLNIAGGPCADSWNALIALSKTHPKLLAGCEVTIAALDIDDSGPAFGQQAIARLQELGAPLFGVQVRFEHIQYRWNKADKLAELLARRNARGIACIASSEGGLFEYGADAEIVANLAALHSGTAPDSSVVGSVTRKCEAQDALQRHNRATTQPRILDEFRSLARQAGWKIERSIERPFTFNVRLNKM